MEFRPATSVRIPSSTFFAELYLTPGPQEIGVTGDNSYQTLYGSEWLFSIEDSTRILRVFQRVDSDWLERTGDPRMPPIVGQAMDEGVRRLSGTFDQSARAVIAYESSEGVVTGTRWDPGEGQYKQNIDFFGSDPCVVIDASWSYAIPGSDVLVFYLSPDRRRLCCRVQRDLYAVEHELWTFDAPVIFDRVLATPYKYQVLVSSEFGVPLPHALVSSLYPIAVSEGVLLSAAFTGGEYRRNAVDYHPLVGARVSAEFVRGAMFSPVVTVPVLGGGVALAAEFTTSALDAIGKPHAPSHGVQLSAAFVGGSYAPG